MPRASTSSVFVPVRQSGSPSQIAARERRKHDHGVERDVEPGRKSGEMARAGSVGDEQDEQRGERRRPPTAQYGGCSAHHGPRALKAFQNAVFAGASSSASSMSGVTSA